MTTTVVCAVLSTGVITHARAAEPLEPDARRASIERAVADTGVSTIPSRTAASVLKR